MKNPVLVVVAFAPLLAIVGLSMVVHRDGPSPQTAQGVLPDDGCRLSLDKYNTLKTGMRYEQAVEIFGCDGVSMSEFEIPASPQFSTVMYKWTGGGITVVTAMFQGGKLISKSQFGL